MIIGGLSSSAIIFVRKKKIVAYFNCVEVVCGFCYNFGWSAACDCGVSSVLNATI